MEGPHDIDQAARAGDGDGLDPREAARLAADSLRHRRLSLQA
jgi:hypothetical protein